MCCMKLQKKKKKKMYKKSEQFSFLPVDFSRCTNPLEKFLIIAMRWVELLGVDHMSKILTAKNGGCAF